MPPQRRIFRQDILQAATKLVREQGAQALSVRALAREMDCSTQPIYSTFANMADLNDALMDYIRQTYLRKQASSYKEVALSFLNFAREEKNLFRLIYLRQRTPDETMFEDPNQTETIRRLAASLQLSQDAAAEMHRRMQYYSYSMAVMMATGYLEFSEQQVSRELTEYYRIILSYYKQVKSEQELAYWLERSRNLLV